MAQPCWIELERDWKKSDGLKTVVRCLHGKNVDYIHVIYVFLYLWISLRVLSVVIKILCCPEDKSGLYCRNGYFFLFCSSLLAKGIFRGNCKNLTNFIIFTYLSFFFFKCILNIFYFNIYCTIKLLNCKYISPFS